MLEVVLNLTVIGLVLCMGIFEWGLENRWLLWGRGGAHPKCVRVPMRFGGRE